MRKIYMTLLFVILISYSFSQETVRTMFSDTPPKFLKPKNGDYSGICFELLMLISKDTGIIFDYPDTFVPMPRIYSNLYNGNIDLCMGLRKTAKRSGRYIIGESLYDVSYKVVVRHDDSLEINNLADILTCNDNEVLTIFGSGSADFLKNLGLTVDDGGKDIKSNIEKLLHNRGRAFIYYNIAIAYSMNNLSKFDSNIRILTQDFSPYPHYIMFSQQTSPEIITRINSSIKKLKSSDEWKKIVQQYTEIDEGFNSSNNQ